jgi:hypothetical protein
LTRFVTRALIVVAATLGIVFAQVAPASATVHEIVGQWCSRGASGKGELAPPGISPPTAKPENVAKPLFASGFITGTRDFIGSAGPGQLITVNYNNPNVKVVGTGVYVAIDPTVPLYIELIKPNPAFPAFKSCPKLATG